MHAREKSYAAYAESNRTLRGLPLEVSAHCATGVYLQCEGTVAIAEWVVSQTKYPRATPLAIAGNCFELRSVVWTQQRNNALRLNSDCEQRPGADDAISRWLHLVTELEDVLH